MPPSRRMQRINQLLRDEIAGLLRRGVKDEVLSTSLISITEVDTSPDLRNAKVYYSVYGTDEEIATARQHLQRAAAFLRRQLMDNLDLRYTPHLEFLFDNSLATGDRIMRLMREIDYDTAPDDADNPSGAPADRAS
jgi:ribosome-binding factor A